MNRLHLAAAAIALAAATAHAETVNGSGKPASDNRPVAGFRSVAISVPGRLEIVQDDREKLTVTADDNILPLIEAVMRGDELQIRFRERELDIRTKTPIRLTLNARVIEAIAVSGSADVQAGSLNAKQMKLGISGSGDITLAGKAPTLEVHIAGSGGVKAGRFEAQTASVSISGSGDALVWARESLRISIAGSGDVRYYGDPAVQRSIAGSGGVRRLGATPG